MTTFVRSSLLILHISINASRFTMPSTLFSVSVRLSQWNIFLGTI